MLEFELAVLLAAVVLIVTVTVIKDVLVWVILNTSVVDKIADFIEKFTSKKQH